jgi:hypothetical protein
MRQHQPTSSAGKATGGACSRVTWSPAFTRSFMATPCPETWDMEHHPSYKDVWERVLPHTRDPYDIMQRHGDA